MRYFFWLAAVWICLCFSSAGCAQLEDATQLQSEALDFEFRDLNNNLVNLASYRDRQPVVLFFWTTWCPHCRKEINILNLRYEELKKEGWEVLAIDSGEPAYRIENYRDRQGINLAFFLDADMQASDFFAIIGVPTYVLINKKGRIVGRAHSFPLDEYKYLLTE
jgi:peroxiredoxin